MARHMQTRKRSRSSAPKSRSFKRRRIVRRRGGNSKAFTSQSGTGGGIRFKGRKTSRSAYKRLLWNTTTMMTKYRTNISVTSSSVTPVTVNFQSLTVRSAVNFGTDFWTAAGGAIAPDATLALPTFTGNIILRGGTIGCRLVNTLDTVAANAGTMHGTVMLIRTTKNFNAASIPTSVPLGWDPSLVVDFNTQVGRIVYKKDFLLRDAEVCDVEYRLKIRKIDIKDYKNFFNDFVWIVKCGMIDSNTAQTYTVSNYYNMAFVGDAV